METQTEVMRRRVHRIGSHRNRTAHRRPAGAAAASPSRTTTGPVAAGATAAQPTPCTPEVRYESPVPHAAWIVGVVLLALVAGVMLGVGISNHWG